MHKYRHLVLPVWAWVLSILSVLGISLPGICQISTDGTLSTEITSSDNRNFVIEAGGLAGSNLFHSFEAFSVPTGGSAYFDQLPSVQNIFSRVTGGNLSEINGEIRANGIANVFLLNPSGIVFGPAASLDIGGSFMGTTAQRLKFADGSELVANSSLSPAQLTISQPVGLQLTGNSGPITVLGEGHNFGVLAGTFETVRTQRNLGLQVAKGQTIALLGNRLLLEGGNVTTPGGRIEIGSVEAGEVDLLSPVNDGFEFGYENVSDFQDIQLLQSASIDAAGAGGGNIQVRGRRISLAGGAAILSDTLGSNPGGLLTVQSDESIEIQGISADGAFLTGFYTDVGSLGTAQGSRLQIETQQLRVFNGGFVSASTFGNGNSGDLIVRAKDIEATGTFTAFAIPTGLLNQAVARSSGDGGNFLIEAERLRVGEGAQVGTGTFGSGSAGNLTVNADTIEVTGTDASDRIFSGLFTQVDATSRGGEAGNLTINSQQLRVSDLALVSAAVAANGMGKGGDVTIRTTNLEIADGGQVTTATLGQGNAGNIEVRADNVDIRGASKLGRNTVSAAISAAVTTTAVGNGGSIEIFTDRLSLSESGAILAVTEGQGNAGNINIEAGEVIVTDPSLLEGGFPSRIIARSRSAGAAGSVNISADQFTAIDQGLVNVSSEVLGDSGNLNLTAPLVRITDAGELTATSATGDRGSINVQADNLLLVGSDGKINTNATTNAATGGNINIDGGLILLTQNSEIVAQAIAGTGGNISLVTEQLLQSANSQIDASSDFGVDGTVTIERLTPDDDPAPVDLPNAVLTLDQLVANSCLVARDRGSGQFIISGSGGLTSTPNSPSQSTFETYRIPTADTAALESEPQETWVLAPQLQSDSKPIEAQSIHRLTDGQVVLARRCQM